MFAPQYWTIEEWIPPKNAIGGVGFWTELDDGRTTDPEEAFRWFGKLQGQGRAVRTVEYSVVVQAECIVPPWEQNKDAVIKGLE